MAILGAEVEHGNLLTNAHLVPGFRTVGCFTAKRGVCFMESLRRGEFEGWGGLTVSLRLSRQARIIMVADGSKDVTSVEKVKLALVPVGRITGSQLKEVKPFKPRASNFEGLERTAHFLSVCVYAGLPICSVA